MNWIEISVQADGEAAEAVSGLFNRLNSRPDGQGGAVTEVGGFDLVGENHHPTVVVKTYLPTDAADTPEVQRQIEEGLWYLGRIYPLGEVQIRPLAEEDWANAWKSSYHPLRIGRHFLVIPAWQTAEVLPEPDDVPVILDPGMAFGTGSAPQHAALPDGDGGCGAAGPARAGRGLRLRHPEHRRGPAGRGAGWTRSTSIPSPSAPPRRTPRSMTFRYPSTSSRQRGAGARPLWTSPDGPKPPGMSILVNILPHVIIGLLEAGLHTYLAPGGRMIFAGIIEEREPDVRAALAEHGLAVVRRLGMGDWVSLVAEAS